MGQCNSGYESMALYPRVNGVHTGQCRFYRRAYGLLFAAQWIQRGSMELYLRVNGLVSPGQLRVYRSNALFPRVKLQHTAHCKFYKRVNG